MLWFVNPSQRPTPSFGSQKRPQWSPFARNPRPSTKKGKRMKKLFGAAAKAHARKLAKTRRRHARRNPVWTPQKAKAYVQGAVATYKKKHPRAKKLSKVRQAAARKYAAAIRRHPDKWTAASKHQGALSRFAALGRRKARKAHKTVTRTAPSKPRKSPKRVAAGKKAARTRATKKAARSRAAKKAAKSARKGKSMATKKHRKSPKRVAAGKKAARTRARHARAGKKVVHRRRRRRSTVAAKAYRRVVKSYKKHGYKGKGRGVRALRRARVSILRTKAYGKGAAKSFVKRFKMRSNPSGMFKDALKLVVPAAIGFFGGRFITRNISNLIATKMASLAPYSTLIAGAGTVALAHFLTRKPCIKLHQYRAGLIAGTVLNVVESALMQFVPPLSAYLGPDVAYPAALPAPVQGVGEYVETGEYLDTGAEQDLAGFMEDTGAFAENINGNRMLPAARMAPAAPARNWSPGVEMGDLFTGIFAKH